MTWPVRLALPFVLVLSGCAAETAEGAAPQWGRVVRSPPGVPPPVPPPPVAPARTTLKDTQTIHNAGAGDATRVWLVSQGADGKDRVVLCDMEFLKATQSLCHVWPEK